MSKRTIYISIPMTGHDMDIQRQYAEVWQRFFERQGYIVINPFNLMDEMNEKYKREFNREPTYAEYLNNDIEQIKSKCTDIFMCSGWEVSRGCLAESYAAATHKVNILYESKFKIE